MLRILLVTLNTLTLGLALFVNYYSSTGKLNGTTVADVSGKYEALFTPASYAFGIWGFIYLGLLAFVGYQWYVALREKDSPLISDISFWFLLSNLANACWIVAWVHEELALSLLFMGILLLSLLMLTTRLRLEVWDAPLRTILFVWWPIAYYLGWIIVATVSNIAAYLVSQGWDGDPLTPVAWTIVMIVIATLIYLYLIKDRNLREAALVGAWGISAIAVKQWGIHNDIAYTAIAAAAVLVIAAGYHGYKNRATSPAVKVQKGEW